MKKNTNNLILSLFFIAIGFFASANTLDLQQTLMANNNCSDIQQGVFKKYSFEANKQGWNINGPKARRLRSPNATDGNFAVRLTKNNGIMSSPSHDLSIFENINLRFNYTAKGRFTHRRSHIHLEGKIGSGNWVRITSRSHKGTSGLRRYSMNLNLNSNWLQDNVRFRIRVTLGHQTSNKFMDIDNFQLIGKQKRQDFFAYSFENNAQGWTLVGRNAKRVRTGFAADGNYAVKLTRNFGKMISPRLDLSNYSNINLDFSYAIKGRYTHRRTHVHLERRIGNGAWVKVRGWNHRGQNSGVRRYNRRLQLCNSWINTPNLQFRIRVTLGHARSSKFAMIDNIRLSGAIDFNADNNSARQSQNTDVESLAKIEAPIEEVVKPVKVYPNPTTDNIMLSNLKNNVEYTIKDVYGSSLKKGMVSGNQQIYTGSLKRGIYILTYVLNGETQQHKFIKK